MATGTSTWIARTAAGALRLYPGNGSNGFLAMRVIGSGWQQFTSIVGSGISMATGTST